MPIDIIVLRCNPNWCERLTCGIESVPHDFAHNGVAFADVVSCAINKAPRRRRITPHRAQRRGHRKCGIAVKPAKRTRLRALSSRGDNVDQHPYDNPCGAFHNFVHFENHCSRLAATLSVREAAREACLAAPHALSSKTIACGVRHHRVVRRASLATGDALVNQDFDLDPTVLSPSDLSLVWCLCAVFTHRARCHNMPHRNVTLLY